MSLLKKRAHLTPALSALKGGEGARHWRRRRRKFCAAIALSVVVFAAAVLFTLDRMFPPDLSRLSQLSQLVEDKDGHVLRAFIAADGSWRLPISAADVDPRFIRMLIAYEDKRFESHGGVDPLALIRAMGQFLTHGHVVSGASTLTMQTARLLEPRPRTLLSKLIEMGRAFQIEERYSKDQILSMYLTLAPYGGNLSGIRAATRFYFAKEPAQLSDAEAALLVALPRSPERFRPDRDLAAAKLARDRVLMRLADAGVMSPAAVREASIAPLPPLRLAAAIDAPQLAARLAADAPGASEIESLIDGDLQRRLQTLALRRQQGMEKGATVAVLVVENDARAVRAYVGSADFFDADSRGQNDMVRAIRSPGSTLKPFVYGLAFDDLIIHPETMIVDAPMRFGDYAPQNFDHRFHGEMTAREALQLSLNVPAVALLSRIGPARFANLFREAGLPLALPDDDHAPGLPIVLGGVGTSLENLVTLYAGLADGGQVRALRLTPGQPVADAHKIMSPRGGLVPDSHPQRHAAAAELACRGQSRQSAAGRLQDRHLLRVPRCLGHRLHQGLHRGRVGRPAGRQLLRRPHGPGCGGSGAVRRVRPVALSQPGAGSGTGGSHRRLEHRAAAGAASLRCGARALRSAANGAGSAGTPDPVSGERHDGRHAPSGGGAG